MFAYSALLASAFLGLCVFRLILLNLLNGISDFVGIIILALSIFTAFKLRLYVINLNKTRNMEAADNEHDAGHIKK